MIETEYMLSAYYQIVIKSACSVYKCACVGVDRYSIQGVFVCVCVSECRKFPYCKQVVMWKPSGIMGRDRWHSPFLSECVAVCSWVWYAHMTDIYGKLQESLSAPIP